MQPRDTSVIFQEGAVSQQTSSAFCLDWFTHNLIHDQKAIWSSPFRLPTLPARDRSWLAPVGIGAFTLVEADRRILQHFGSSPLAHSGSFSDYGLAALAGGGAAFYLSGIASGDAHRRETGLLTGEAAVNSVLVGEAMKLVFQRPRPNEKHAGSFGAGGASFPSEHALAAWSMATVIAHEYPGPMTKLLAYGAATGIRMSATRPSPIMLDPAKVFTVLSCLRSGFTTISSLSLILSTTRPNCRSSA